MTNFIEAIAKSLKGNEYAERSLKFLNDLISYDENESDEAIVFKKGNCEIRIGDDKIELIHDRLVSTKLTITKGDIFVKWRDGTVLNLEDAKRVSQFMLRPQTTTPSAGTGANINAQAPLSYNPSTGNLAIALNPQPPLSFNPSTGNLGIAINAQAPVTFNPNTGNLAIALAGVSPITYNSATGEIGIRFSPQFPLTFVPATGNLSITLGAVSPLSFNSSTGNFSISATPGFSSMVLSAPNTTTIPLIINTVTGGANTLEIRRADNSVGFTIFNSGSIEVGLNSFYRHTGNQVLGGRRTGWTAATGTATRTTFATSTVTTAQLAERVHALLQDLFAHGIIGN